MTLMMSGSSDSSLGHTSGGRYPKTTSLTPRSLLKRHPPPVSAHLRTPNCPPGLDLSRPLLIFSNYVSTKIRATSLRLYREGYLTQVGPPLVIPDSYSGWFAVISSDGTTAPFYTSVEQVVAANISFFLTRYDAPAYVIIENEVGITSYKRTLVQGGNVLKLLGVFEDFTTRFSDGPCKFFGCKKYAQCQDFNNQVVYLPLNVSGKFYSTGQKSSSKSISNVYLISHLLKNFKLPLTVKLVCGYMPRAPCAFTGILRLEKSQQEEVMLACTMTSEAHATLFEIEVDSSFIFTPITDPLFPKTPIYLKTISYCEDEADLWQRQIKVTHHVTEKRSHSLTRTMSDKFKDPFHSVKSLNVALLADSGRSRKSREKPLKERIEDTFGKHYAKRNLKKGDKRKLRTTKNNPYVFQLIRRHRSLSGMLPAIHQPPTKELPGTRLSQSFDNLDYCRVLDDITTILERRGKDVDEDEEDHYTTIGEPSSFLLESPPDVTTGDDSSSNILTKTKLDELEESGSQKDNFCESSYDSTDTRKKESIDSGTYVDYDESYFSMDYGEVSGTIRSEERSEIGTKERQKEPCTSNFILGNSNMVRKPTNLPSRRGKENITVSLSSYGETGTQGRFRNGSYEIEAVKRTASLNTKEKTPEISEKIYTKSAETSRCENSQKISTKSAINIKNIDKKRDKDDAKKVLEESLDESKTLQETKAILEITEPNSIVQPTEFNNCGFRPNSDASRKDEYLIEGEDVSVISIVTSAESDALQMTSSHLMNGENKNKNLDGRNADNNCSARSVESKSDVRCSERIITTSSEGRHESITLLNNDFHATESLLSAFHRQEESLTKEERTEAIMRGERKVDAEKDLNGEENQRYGDSNDHVSAGDKRAEEKFPEDVCGKDAFLPKERDPAGIRESGRILMRGNTVVIRVKDAEPKRPRISEQTFEPIGANERTDSTREIKSDSIHSSNYRTNHSPQIDRNCDNQMKSTATTNIKRNVSTVKINKWDPPPDDELAAVDMASITAVPTGLRNEEMGLSNDVTGAKCQLMSLSNNENFSEQKRPTKSAIKDFNDTNDEGDKLIGLNGPVITTSLCNVNNFRNNDNNRSTAFLSYDSCVHYDATSLTNTAFSIADTNFPENHILHNFDVRKLNGFKMSNDVSRKEESLIIKNSGNVTFSTITNLTSDEGPLEEWDLGDERAVDDTSNDAKDTTKCPRDDDAPKEKKKIPKGPEDEELPETPIGSKNPSSETVDSAPLIKRTEPPLRNDIDRCGSDPDLISDAINRSIRADDFGVVVLTLTRSNGIDDAEKESRNAHCNRTTTMPPEGGNQSEC